MNNSTSETRHSSTHSGVVAWCLTFGIVAAVTIAGNALTIVVFLKKKLPRKFGGYFLINLAVADLMVGALALPMYIYIVVAFTYTPYKSDLAIFQHVYTLVDVFTGLASVFTLASIALERLYGTLYPLQYRWKATKRVYVLVIAIVWTLSGTTSMAYIFSAPTLILLLPEKMFTFYLTGVSMISLLVICAAYLAVSLRIRLWNKLSKMEISTSKQEKRLAAALFIVTVTFVLTWSPFHILNILANFTNSFLNNVPVDIIFSGKLLHYSNSLANPVIYSLKIPEFRIAVRKLFCKNWVRETRV